MFYVFAGDYKNKIICSKICVLTTMQPTVDALHDNAVVSSAAVHSAT